MSSLHMALCFLLFALFYTANGEIRQNIDGSVMSNSGPENADRRLQYTELRVSKRAILFPRLITAYWFNEGDMKLLVDEHNKYRRMVSATDMRELAWDSNLATSAQAHANTCTFQHSTNRINTGENIWAAPFSNFRNAVQLWFDEVYDTGCGCTNFYKHCCGHYTQVVWAATNRIGCGFAQCSNIAYLPARHHYVLVCHYSPAGNTIFINGNGEIVGVPGFTYRRENEKACSACASSCNDSLCIS